MHEAMKVVSAHCNHSVLIVAKSSCSCTEHDTLVPYNDIQAHVATSLAVMSNPETNVSIITCISYILILMCSSPDLATLLEAVEVTSV